MTVTDIIERLTGRNITVSLNGDDLAIKAPSGAVQPEWLVYLKVHKPEIVAFLKERVPAEPAETIPSGLTCPHCGNAIDPHRTDWTRTGDAVVHDRCGDAYGLALYEKDRPYLNNVAKHVRVTSRTGRKFLGSRHRHPDVCYRRKTGSRTAVRPRLKIASKRHSSSRGKLQEGVSPSGPIKPF